ncbi:MAG TPA: TonB-dependent receptor [Terracidiphilus sp.]|nr:TonB-dependent receptor [Terracidiphilus sp.]
MNRTVRTALVLAIIACAGLLLSIPTRAQSVYGSIFGTVTDTTGAAIPNATITVRDEAKGTVVTTVSNASGDYTVPHLIPDSYMLRVTAKGFKNFETKGITVQADTAPRIDPTLEVGAENTTVTVDAESQPELKTDRADVSTVFDSQQVASLPVPDQNFTSLQLLLPGAQLLGWSHAATEDPQGSRQIQVDGQAFGGTAFELDGTDNQDPILGIIVINPALDAVTETKITTQNFDAELGKAVSAVVTAQTRSGTNKFHGSVYDYRTGNANLAHNPFSGAVIPAGIKSRYGGSIGGPVIHDRAFFFGNYEAVRSKVGTSNSDTVPTAHLVASCLGTEAPYAGTAAGCDFSEYATALGVTSLIYDNSTSGGGNAYANNVIPTAQLSAPAVAIMKLMQPYAPNNGASPTATDHTGIANNFSGSGSGLFNADSWTVRGDYTINEKMHAFGRFSRFTDTLSGKPMYGDAGGPGYGTGGLAGSSKGANDSLATGMDIALNSKLLTDWRIGYYRYNITTAKYDQGVEFANQIGIPGINTGSYFTSGAPGWNVPVNAGGVTYSTSHIGAGLNIGRCNCPLTEKESQLQFVNNWTKVMGNHSLKVGVDLRFANNLRVPSDTDRAGLFNMTSNQTSSNGTDGLAWASFMLGNADSFGRYVSVSTNAKENQKRLYFYGQDTWRASQKLTMNLGLRWELYTPEAVNASGNGALLNINDGYMHVAGVGGVPLNMGWSTEKSKTLAPRIGVTYQLDSKTVIRAGYGRSFDLGVFGSLFGHVVTQNLPILANQSVNRPGGITSTAVNFSVGPTAATLPSVPSNGLLPAQGYAVSPKGRPNPLRFPTLDAWNLSVEHAFSPSTSVTIAYVGNKGTHTLGDTDQNNTNPNEAALFLPGKYSVTGQTLNWDPAGLSGGTTALPSGYSGGVSTSKYLQRYYGGSLAACKDANYISLSGLQSANGGDVNLTSGMCGWANGISWYGDDENTEFDALQLQLHETLKHGLSLNANYQWASAFGDANGYWTWDHTITHYRDSNVRRQQITLYGSYDLPFGKGRQIMPNANRITDLIIGGYQIAGTFNTASGLPWSAGYSDFNTSGVGTAEDCNHNVGGTSAPCRPNAKGHLSTNLGSFNTSNRTRKFYDAQPTTGGIYSFPGLDVIGDAGGNTLFGPGFWTSDLALTKAFTVWESVAVKFRLDAFNAFNHITAGNPSNNVLSEGTISSQAQGCDQPGASCGPRQLEFTLRVQF